MPAETVVTETRPLSPLAALTLVLVFPGKTFRRLTERPHWILPLVFVIVAVMLNRMLAISSGVMDDMLRGEAFLSGAGLSEAKSAALTFSVVSSLVAVPVVTLLQSLFFRVFGGLFGGRARFRTVFSAVCHASIPVGLAAIALSALLPVTHSPNAAANLAFLIDPAEHPFVWGLAMELDLSALWFFVLLGIAAEPVFGLPRKRARLATAAFALVYVLVMSWIGMASAGTTTDPLAGWETEETPEVVLHLSPGAPEETRQAAAEACREATARAAELTGIPSEGRIECYLYPSVDEKLRITGNPNMAHRVEWAQAVHVAWEAGASAALAREALKLAHAQEHGSVYNPLVRDGLAVYAGGTWGGLPVREAGKDLLERKALPGLDVLLDPVSFLGVDERISQPAAGSFMSFVIDEAGAQSAREIYRATALRPEETGQALEQALSDSIESIESRWFTYLKRTPNAPEAGPSGDR